MAVGTFHNVEVGTKLLTPARTITAEEADAIVSIGGYTHPLFTDAAYAAASAFGRSPLPGQAVLLFMGGLIEQSGHFDETTIALVRLDGVRFMAPAFVGDTINVEIAVDEKNQRTDKPRGALVMTWLCRNQHATVLVEAHATMHFQTDLEATK